MTLLRLIQRASILAGMTFASLPFYGNIAHADTPTPQFCVIASNGKTVCGTLKEVERACVTTDDNKTVCGKYKSVRGEQAQQETRNLTPIASFRKEVDNFVYTLEGCQRVDTNVRCQIKIVNKGKERSINSLSERSSLVDFTGKSHIGSKVDLGGSPEFSVFSTIASGADAYLGITFNDVSGSIVKAQLLNVKIGNRPIQFRNISIAN
ncbi:hypothetical protein [Chamaesiphon sp. OTE_20_metabat_361]|uniref:hypothetical protein n=1 Tax=Chamaesiphon sp. OTE_20_metabat_361 TaxID=2964689 RepID=UPI00286D0EBC|nr:hypothetical protein [Chamaesiphon sp. OTE_20_metabat_361]